MTTPNTFKISALSYSIGGLKCLKISPRPETTPEVVREGLIYDLIQYLDNLKSVHHSPHGGAPSVALLCMSDIVGSIKKYFKPINVNLSVYCKTDSLVRRAIYIPANETPQSWPKYSSTYDSATCSMAELMQVAITDGNTVFIPCFSSASQIAPDLFSMKKDFHAVFAGVGMVPYALFTEHFCSKFEEQLPQNETLFERPWGGRTAYTPSSLETMYTFSKESPPMGGTEQPFGSQQTKAIKICYGPSTTRTNRILETLFGPTNVIKKETYNVSWITNNTHILLAKVLKGNASARVGGENYQKLELTITKGSPDVEVLVWETNGEEIGSNFQGDKYKNPLFKPHVTFSAVNKEDDYEVVKMGLDGPMNVPPVSEESVLKYEELFEKVISMRLDREWSAWETTIKSIWEEKGVISFKTQTQSQTQAIMEEALHNIVFTIPFRTHQIPGHPCLRSDEDLYPPRASRPRGGHPGLSRATSQVI